MTDRYDVTTPRELSGEGASELSLRPGSLSEFIGQGKVRETLSIAIAAARKRKDALDHLLFHGPPGLGKTTLAMLLASEMGVGVKMTSGPVLEKPGDLVSTLTNLNDRDILFIDEIHRLRPIVEEFLYPAMEDFRVEIRLGDGPAARTVTMQIERFTLVGATTRFGLLTEPMRARFGMVERLDFYPPEDLTRVVQRSAEILGVDTTEEGVFELARRARGTPRVANRLLRRVRDYAEVRADGMISGEVARAGLRLLEVDEYGMDEMDARVLRTIIEKFSGGPVGLGSLAVALSEDEGTLEEVYEPFLIQNGFLERTPRGRKTTERAHRRFGHPSAAREGRSDAGAGGRDQSSLFRR
ncbi:MAG: Holliday junction branch migration DNA helicase RuvB [Gammaproteobacteria bacterium]|nr:Holliday junction branch migration DNA helicase RuvB [Gammaproteobacteria bacterium]